MALFSERYNYVKPSEVLLRECFPEEVANGVCSCYDGLEEQLACNPYQDYGFQYADLEDTYGCISYTNVKVIFMCTKVIKL